MLENGQQQEKIAFHNFWKKSGGDLLELGISKELALVIFRVGFVEGKLENSREVLMQIDNRKQDAVH